MGTSEESTAGGVLTRYGQALGSCAGIGSAQDTAGVPVITSAAAMAAARRTVVNVAMGWQVRRFRTRNRGAALWRVWLVM